MQCPACGIDDAMYDRLLAEIETLQNTFDSCNRARQAAERENETLKSLRDELFDRLKEVK